MASKKDMRRPDLVIPYVEPETEKSEGDISSTVASTLPMAAMFTRNKMIGWTAVLFAVQSWLGESPSKRKESSQPAFFTIGIALLSLVITYLPLFLPPPGQMQAGTGTEAPAAVPPA